jgi:hypothetical protein
MTEQTNRDALPSQPGYLLKIRGIFVPTSQWVWLYLGFYDWHTFLKMSS